MSTETETVDVSGFVEAHKDGRLEAPGPSIDLSSPTTIHDSIPEPKISSGGGPLDNFMQVQPDLPDHLEFEQSAFWQDYTERAQKGQDIVILISDYQNDRGTGKTALSIKMAELLDQTDEGLIPEKASIAPEALINSYTNHPRQSSLILDEAEAGVGSREAMTKINRTLNTIVSMGRVEEKYLILNMPASNHIDKNIIDLAHYWILVQDRGVARVYRLENNPFEQKKYPSPVQQLEWSDISGHNAVYRSLTVEKQSRLDNGGGPGKGEAFVPIDKHQEAVEKAVEKRAREVRDNIIVNALNHPRLEGIPQSVIADITDMSQGHVSNVKKRAEEEGQLAPLNAD